MQYTDGKMKRLKSAAGGFTLIELLVTTLILGVMATVFLGLFVSLVHSTVVAKRQAVALTLATNQMEYLKSLPYNNMAVTGGSIIAPVTVPPVTTKTLNGVKYTLTTNINYVDDAYDGCGSYPSGIPIQTYCRNYPPPASAPATDQNPQDYKILDVSVTDPSNTHLAELNSQVSARVSETASNTGALFVHVIDDAGNPITSANVSVSDTTLAPNVNVSDNTDENGVAIFYGLPPDTNGYDYVISASKTGYSSLTTMGPNGTLQPTYASQKIISQQSSSATLTIKPQGAPSLLIEATDTTGNPLNNTTIPIKGGYKKYTATSDTSYYYSASLTTGTTDNQTAVSNLVPGTYFFCGDTNNSCKVGGSTYYLAAALPYSGNNPFNPIKVPTYDSSNPPTTTYPYNGTNYLQKVRLVLAPTASFPEINTISPYDVSLASGTPATFTFAINGTNLPCSSSAASCSTSVKFLQASNTYTASCTGSSAGAQLSCTINMTGATAGSTQLSISNSGGSLTIPAGGPLGGLLVTP